MQETVNNHLLPIQYLSEKKVSEMTGIPVSSLQKQRHYRRGIPYSKLEKLVRYKLQDVIDYLERHKITHDAQ
jgi:hypothetical protein